MSSRSKKRKRSRRERTVHAEAVLRNGMVAMAICAGAGMWGYAAMSIASRAL